MKKYIYLISLGLISQFTLFAQDAKIASVELNKVPQPCVMVDYSLPANIVEGALRKKMADAKFGSGDKTKDGFRLYKGITMNEIAPEKMDVYFKIDDKKDNSTVYMLTSKGYDNFMKKETDSLPVQNSIQFLNSFVNDATAFSLSNQIEKQNDVIKDNEKKVKNELKDGENLQKDRAKLESNIAKNAIQIVALKSEMEAKQKAFEGTKLKTATVEGMKALKKEVDKAEDVAKKAAKNYNNALKNEVDYKEDLNKLDKKIEDNYTAQASAKNQVEADKAKLEELKLALSNLKK